MRPSTNATRLKEHGEPIARLWQNATCSSGMHLRGPRPPRASHGRRRHVASVPQVRTQQHATPKPPVLAAIGRPGQGRLLRPRAHQQGVLPKGFALLPAAAGGEHFVDPRTCSIIEAIKLSRENNPLQMAGGNEAEACDLEAGSSLHTLFLRHDGPASCEQPSSLIATEPNVRQGPKKGNWKPPTPWWHRLQSEATQTKRRKGTWRPPKERCVRTSSGIGKWQTSHTAPHIFQKCSSRPARSSSPMNR